MCKHSDKPDPKAAVHAPCRVAWRAAGTAPPNVTQVLTPSVISVCFGTAQDGVVLSNAKLELRKTKATLHLDATDFARAAGVLVSIHGLRITLLCHSFRELLWVAAVDADLTAVVAKWRGCEQGWEREESTRTWWGRGRGRGRRAGTGSRRGAGVRRRHRNSCQQIESLRAAGGARTFLPSSLLCLAFPYPCLLRIANFDSDL
ncbi:hypothetical protein B0H14DRAFT_3036160 [Mycena olivaceomarginata]|nr:hypothetical protein B0H14DRAFT_3036160 [Mycena olivaceomarginata]